MMYKLKNKVMIQHHYKIENEESVLDYIMRTEELSLNPNETFIVVAVDGVLYEFNMVAAIILEELLVKESYDVIAQSLMLVFNVDISEALKTIEDIVKDLIDKGIIEKHE